MNPFYEVAVDALGMWSADATSLLDGTEELWHAEPDEKIEEKLIKVQAMGDRELVLEILKGKKIELELIIKKYCISGSS